MEGQELATQNQGYSVVNFEDYAMNVGSLVKQITLIQDAMSKVMRENEHYGTIPGTPKPTLLKPGAEKLCLMFRLDPDYEIIREVREDYFIAYTIKCTLNHIPTGQRIGSGIGSCNSRESKYRFRHDAQMTDTEVPKAYWDAKNANNSQEMKRILGPGNRAKKNEETGKWVIARSVQVENDNPWDLDNTLIKMACKRALVAATLNATAASDIFTQDIEDMPEGTGNAPTTQQTGTQGKAGKPPVQQPKEKKAAAPSEARTKFPDGLEQYCVGDVNMMQDVCEQVSTFKNKDGEERNFSLADVMAQREDGSYVVSDPWMNAAYGKLKKLIEGQGA